eukprot:6186045-Pleurochrysis_carterae.AAC.2
MQQPCRRSSDERVKIMYADGEVEEWPITVVEAERMRRRPCARLQGQTAAYLWRKLRAQPFWSAEVSCRIKLICLPYPRPDSCILMLLYGRVS